MEQPRSFCHIGFDFADKITRFIPALFRLIVIIEMCFKYFVEPLDFYQ